MGRYHHVDISMITRSYIKAQVSLHEFVSYIDERYSGRFPTCRTKFSPTKMLLGSAFPHLAILEVSNYITIYITNSMKHAFDSLKFTTQKCQEQILCVYQVEDKNNIF